jgi:uncharacterized repeat protein (TIGR03803 family)
MKLLVQDFLIAAALAFSVTHLSAQTHNILHSFGSFPRDGSAPLTDLVLGSNTLYGTTASGGTNYNGTIFKINTDGSGYGVIQNLTDSPSPEGGMVLISNTLYGTTFTGGSASGGSVFKINTDASDFAVVKTFSATYVGSNYVSGNILTSSGANDDCAKPTVGLVLDGSTLYGATYHGGTSNGVVFAMQTDGSGY